MFKRFLSTFFFSKTVKEEEVPTVRKVDIHEFATAISCDDINFIQWYLEEVKPIDGFIIKLIKSCILSDARWCLAKIIVKYDGKLYDNEIIECLTFSFNNPTTDDQIFNILFSNSTDRIKDIFLNMFVERPYLPSICKQYIARRKTVEAIKEILR